MVEEEMAGLVKRIKDRRLELGLSYQDLSKLTGISRSTLQRYETGYIKKVPINQIELMASALTVSPGYLMGWEDRQAEPKDGPNSGEESNNLDKKLRYAMLHKGILSIADLAARAGLPRTTLYDVFKARTTNISAVTAAKLAGALGCTVEYLVKSDIPIEGLVNAPANGAENTPQVVEDLAPTGTQRPALMALLTACADLSDASIYAIVALLQQLKK